jgi:hypothetical protein
MQSNMKRSIFAVLVLAGTTLVACSGGGTGSHNALPSATGTTAPATNGKGNGLSGPTAKITITIPRHTASGKGKHASAVRGLRGKTLAARRTPKEVSENTQGLQIAVTGNGTTQTVYADASSHSSLCTTIQNPQSTWADQSCTLEVPVVAASETITVDAVDVTPNDEGVNGNPPGYGDGFSNGHVLDAGTTTASLTAGATTPISLALGQVTGGFYDCGYANLSNSSYVAYDSDAPDETPASLPAGYNSTDNSTALGRIVFTAGQAGWIQVTPWLADWDDDTDGFASPSPALVDVNASPQAVTATTSLQHVGLATSTATAPLGCCGAPPTPPPFASTTSSVTISDQSYFWMYDAMPVIDVVYDGSTAAVAGTINVKNNLTATDLFGNLPYTFVVPYTVAFVSAIPTSLSLALDGTNSLTVTGTDFQAAANGMVSSNCVNGSNTQLATVTAGTMNTTTWQQTFTVTATATGTCYFILVDRETGVVSQQVTVTIGS